jgi:uncharacterized protein YggU (UPF0235/DUF167 family)
MNSKEPVKSGDAVKEVASILANGITRMKKKIRIADGDTPVAKASCGSERRTD